MTPLTPTLTTPLTIACDVDGVIAACAPSIIQWNVDRGILSPAALAVPITSWDMSRIWPEISFARFKDDRFWAEIPPIPGALPFIRSLREMGRVVFISHCPSLSTRSGWLVRHGFSDTGEFFSATPAEKPDLARDLGCALFVEDHPDTLVALIPAVRRVYGIRHPYNTHVGDRVFLGDHAEVTRQIREDFSIGEGARSSIPSDLAIAA